MLQRSIKSACTRGPPVVHAGEGRVSKTRLSGGIFLLVRYIAFRKIVSIRKFPILTSGGGEAARYERTGEERADFIGEERADFADSPSSTGHVHETQPAATFGRPRPLNSAL